MDALLDEGGGSPVSIIAKIFGKSSLNSSRNLMWPADTQWLTRVELPPEGET
jgi:hypothetical protein